ncbi:response regulator transcription factor [Raoultibacter phocaeensis]|uniref:response regulator transcription factor n=1 Tax=Raoultibacter phocaeensis TaxID=2479841 RepID=UPI00111BA8D5|nr:response regulator transcription factor [Raoultibacter phocaeensis]
MSDKPSILIIEDDADINEVLAAFLSRHGFACTQAYSGSEARLLLGLNPTSATDIRGSAGSPCFSDQPDAVGPSDSAGDSGAASFSDAASPRTRPLPFDLVITDLMLPGMSGEEIVAAIRRCGDVPVIVLSARGAAADKVELLGLGADDYLAKPFDLDEVLARVLVQLRHASKAAAVAASAQGSGEAERDASGRGQTVRFKLWEVDPESRTLAAAGEPVKLTRLEYNIVEALVRRPKKVFTKRELYEAAWNEDCFIEEKAINVHISNIRSKLKATHTDSYIETVWGIGFKLAE